jgi:DMSO reductase anchor subunit
VDSVPVRYEMDEAAGRYLPRADADKAGPRQWNLGKLLTSHEMAHVAFTLTTQAVMGAFALVLAGDWASIAPLKVFANGPALAPALWIMTALMAFGLFKLNMHLGRPHRFYRGFYNLRHSPVSREIAGVSAFFAGLAGYAFFSLFDNVFAKGLAQLSAALGLAGLAFGGYWMYRLYRIKARPFWDHWHTAASFIATGLTLGALIVALGAAFFDTLYPAQSRLLGAIAAAGLAIEAAGVLGLWRDLRDAASEGAASWLILTRAYGKTFILRMTLMTASFALSLTIALNGGGAGAWLLLATLAVPAAIIGRALFFSAVIPTTMPGAYFWKNPGFVAHARETGLADMPQLGVAYEGHHKFRLDELLATIRETTWREKLDQLRRVFTG